MDGLYNLGRAERFTFVGQIKLCPKRIRARRLVKAACVLDVVVRLFSVRTGEVWPRESGILGYGNLEPLRGGLVEAKLRGKLAGRLNVPLLAVRRDQLHF